ncbi:MAG: MBL fold metallo-hydrolase [Alphaproteobacteria bacterium]|nr:MBL fold metallo-hydrolase [Alphaproteobacteria bacterium]
MNLRSALHAALLTSAFAIPAQNSFGQATPETASIPQPHLAKARAEAFQDNNWKFPALITCYPNEGQPAEKVIKDPGPAKVADNFYFLGDGIVAAWAVDTSDGIILIDTLNNQAEVDKYIIGGLQKLGLDPAHIKTIIISHGHGDHYGGGKYLQDKYGAKIYMTAPDYDFMEKNAGRNPVWGPPPRRDQVATDGQTVTLGDTGIKLFITTGHTPASLSMLIPVKDKGQVRTLLYLGGITNKGLTPAMHTAYDEWTTRLLKVSATEKPAGVIGNHSSYDEAATKIEKIRAKPNDDNPFFTGTASALRYLRVLKECNLNNAEIERAQRKP